MVNTRKFSQFPAGVLQEGVGLTNAANTRGPAGGGGGGSTSIITQVAHGLDRGQWVRFNGVGYVLASAVGAVNAEVIGVVSSWIDANTFVLQQSGVIVDLSRQVAGVNTYLPMIPGEVYFISETIPGEVQGADVVTVNNVRRSCIVATTEIGGWVVPYVGQIIGNGSAGVPASGPNLVLFDQPNAFVIGSVVRVSAANTVVGAQADTRANAQAVGVVVELNINGDPNKFFVQTEGYTNKLVGLVAAANVYYLSDAVAGAYTNIEPAAQTSYSKPILVGLSNSEAFILEQKQTLVGSVGGNIVNINQPGHGFVAGDVGKFVRTSAVNNTYVLGLADNLVNSRVVGMIITVTDANNFSIQTEGLTGVLAGLIAGETRWLSDVVPGETTSVEPSVVGSVSKPVLQVVNPTTAYVLEQRPLTLPIGGGGGDPIRDYDECTLTTVFSMASQTWADTGLSCTVTTFLASDRVVVFASCPSSCNDPGNAPSFRVVRNMVVTLVGDAAGVRAQALTQGDSTNTGASSMQSAGFVVVDSPGVAGTYQYKVQMRVGDVIGNVFLNRGDFDNDNINNARGASQVITMVIA